MTGRKCFPSASYISTYNSILTKSKHKSESIVTSTTMATLTKTLIATGASSGLVSQTPL